jgi:hypothetical protein
MGINKQHYAGFERIWLPTLEEFSVPARERDDVMNFLSNLATEIVER